MNVPSTRHWLAAIAGTLALGLATSAGAEVLLCNEEIEEGKHCGVEVKCYHEDIVGGLEFNFEAEGVVMGHEFYREVDEGDDVGLCAGLNFLNPEETPKWELKCTENAQGKDSEGDVAVEIEFNLAGCQI